MGQTALTTLALLRAPPFPGVNASVSGGTAPSAGQGDAEKIFAIVREARVGGCFWGAPAALSGPAETVIRPRTTREIASLRRDGALWIAPGQIAPGREWTRALTATEQLWRAGVDPWSVLPGAGLLVAHGDDEWVALARLSGVPVEVLSSGRFGAPGDDAATLDRKAAQALEAPQWRNPFSGEAATFEETVDLLALWRSVLEANRPIVAACGMAWWKRHEIRRFLWHPGHALRFAANAAQALDVAGRAGGAVAIWPSRVSPILIERAAAQGVPLVRVEDGFVRSVGLGVELVPPSSIVVDAAGIHFDASRPSDLETILGGTEMPPRLLERARALRETIVAAGISKYAAGGPGAFPERQPGRRLVLVTGQVEDDMSVLAAGGGTGSNLALLQRARAMEPDAEIWFRPHPDVDAGHRKGAIADSEALLSADRVVRGGSMAALLGLVDGVHVLSSLAGFEALMRGREVTCHAAPFYAGWGLTRDLGAVPERRSRKLTLDALVAGVLILYPRYLDPVTGLPCPPEVLVGRMAGARAVNRLGWIAPLRRWQGRLMSMFR